MEQFEKKINIEDEETPVLPAHFHFIQKCPLPQEPDDSENRDEYFDGMHHAFYSTTKFFPYGSNKPISQTVGFEDYLDHEV